MLKFTQILSLVRLNVLALLISGFRAGVPCS